MISGAELLPNSFCLVPVLADLQSVPGAGMAGVANMLTGQWGTLLCTVGQGRGFFSVCIAMFRMYRKLCLSTYTCAAYALQYILYSGRGEGADMQFVTNFTRIKFQNNFYPKNA